MPRCHLMAEALYYNVWKKKERLRRQRSSQRLGLWEPFPLLTSSPPLLEHRLETLPSGSGDILPQSLIATQPVSR